MWEYGLNARQFYGGILVYMLVFFAIMGVVGYFVSKFIFKKVAPKMIEDFGRTSPALRLTVLVLILLLIIAYKFGLQDILSAHFLK